MSFTHGTNYGYRRKKCRCKECREWNAAYGRAYRARRIAADPNYYKKNHMMYDKPRRK